MTPSALPALAPSVSTQQDHGRANAADNFRLPAGAPPVACVDIGGTKVAVSVADAAGLRGRLSEPTVRTGDQGALAAQIMRMLSQSCSAAGTAPERHTGTGRGLVRALCDAPGPD